MKDHPHGNPSPTSSSSVLPSKNLTKTCREKVMKEKLKCVKVGSSLFIHHSSFRESIAFAARKVSFGAVKAYVSSHETWSFTRRNMVFGAAKPYLWQIYILQTARLQFKIRVTICQLILYEKPQKSAFFRPSDLFVTNTPCFLGPKFEYSFTNPRYPKYPIANDASGIGQW